MAEVTRAKFMQKLKGRSKGAWSQVRNTEAKARGRMLPGGIQNGIANLSSFKLGETTSGDPFVTITGIVTEPPECEGMRATSMFFLNENQYATFKDNYEVFCSGLQLLGIETSKIAEDDILKALEERCKEAPAYYFNTQAQRNGQGVNVYIQGLVDEADTPKPAAPKAGGARRPAPQAAPEPEPDEGQPMEWDVGHEVIVDYDGTEYRGTIDEVQDSGCNVTFEDGSADFVEFDRLIVPDPDADNPQLDPDEGAAWDVGSRCLVDYDGTLFAGTINEITDDGALVDFDDGTQASHSLDELLPEEGSGDWVPEANTVYGFEDKGKVKAFICTKVDEAKQTVDLKEEKNARNVKKGVAWTDLLEAPE